MNDLDNQIINKMNQVFDHQKREFKINPYPQASERIYKLKELKKALIRRQNKLCEAVSKDFGHRAHYDTLISDILPSIGNIDYSIKKIKKWMKPSKRSSGIIFAPANVEVVYQPKGVVGIIVPWNFPIMLALSPLIAAVSAGNRAMIKMSEFTPLTNIALKELLSEVFDDEEVYVVEEGEVLVANAFSKLAFDHLLFTGSTAVGKIIMRNAAENLTPVTLELGGKSPAIIDDQIDMDEAVERLIYGKTLNAGQICVSPDYIFVPTKRRDDFVESYIKAFNKMYIDKKNTEDYSCIVNDRQFERITNVLNDAKEKGAKIIEIAPELEKERRMHTKLVLNPTEEMTILQDEIFGPLLPILTYESFEQVINYVKDRPRPLACYLMSYNSQLKNSIKYDLHSGGVSFNDTVMQAAIEDAPFGGVGNSGMGHYHGIEGFKTFSHAKTVFSRPKWFYPMRYLVPPYGNFIHKLMKRFFLS